MKSSERHLFIVIFFSFEDPDFWKFQGINFVENDHCWADFRSQVQSKFFFYSCLISDQFKKSEGDSIIPFSKWMTLIVGRENHSTLFFILIEFLSLSYITCTLVWKSVINYQNDTFCYFLKAYVCCIDTFLSEIIYSLRISS